jgi:predicted Zn-dependent peptidase
LFTLNKYLGQTLPAFFEILTEANFPEKELSTFILNNNQRILVENEKVMSIARKKFNELLFGAQHPYGHTSTTSDYSALNSKDLLDYHRRQYVSEHCTILVSGKVNSATLSLINSHLGDKTWSRSNGAISKSPEPDTQEPGKYFVCKEGAIQSAIRIGKRIFTRSHPDYPGFAMLNTILGGYFGSRLMSNIREDKGYTYGIHSGLVSMLDQGYFTISTEVGSKVTRQAIDEIYREMKILCEEEVGHEEMETVRNYMLGSFIKNLETAFHLSDRFKTIYLQGLDYDYYERYLNKIRTIQASEVLQLAQNYLDPDSMTELVVGPK